MMNPEHPPIIIQTNPNPECTIIWLHGLGADGNDFVPLAPDVSNFAHQNIRFVFPNAPSRPVSINGGFVMPAWYDIYSIDRQAKQDEAGIVEASHYLRDLVITESAEDRPIFLAGFSQGGAVALYTTLTHALPIKGLIVLSAYLPLAHHFPEKLHQSTPAPIFLAHGTEDDVVPYHFATDTLKALEQHQLSLTFKTYPMAHQVCMEEVQDLSQFVHQQMKN